MFSRALLLLSALLTLPLFAQLSPVFITLAPITRSADGTMSRVTVFNRSEAALTDVDVEIALTATGRPVTLNAAPNPSWACTSVDPQKLHCRIAFLPEGASPSLGLTIGFAGEGRFSLTAKAAWADGQMAEARESALFPRDVFIRNTNDAGEGSLRAAIEYANDVCARDLVPCALRFSLTETPPAQGWYTIRPQSPLPAITAPDISIERRHNEPRVELDGSLLAIGHGLQLRGEGPAVVDGLAIGGFPWDGIAITRRDSSVVARCFLGVHPDRTPNPNGSRGVTIDPPASNVTLDTNVIAANVRSGVFIWGGENITLVANGIGYQTSAFNADTRLANGASGVLAGPESRNVVLTRNLIGGNRHMGVAVARGARGVRIENTWIEPNAGLPIDHGLDEFSGYVHQNAERALPAPRLTSAVYDAVTSMVTVTGTFDAPDPAASWTLTLFPDRMLDWPERALRTHTFTGTTFIFTMPWFERPVFRATVSSAQPSEWSTSEISESIQSTVAARPLRIAR